MRAVNRAAQIFALLLMLRENREMDYEMCVIFGTRGCPKQLHIVQKSTPQTIIKRAKDMLSKTHT
jgi:hypothetical protein